MNDSGAMKPGMLDSACVNTIRTLSIDAIQQANSGHPGAPMGLAPAAYVLWTKIMKHNPKNPDWFNRDRFVLSGGHASALLYSLLYLTGYDLELDEIKNFRQWGSRTPGHPEYGHTPGVETTTGPLGQGIANAVGMAMAEKRMEAIFNKNGMDIVDHNVYAICGDGDLMEGVAYEAASLAGHLELSNLVLIYDDNKISIEGSTSITFTEDVEKRFEASKWRVITVEDGNNLQAIEKALCDARDEVKKPTLIKLRTEIAYGSPNMQGTSDAHGAPLGADEIVLTKKNLNCPPDESFYVSDEVLTNCRKCVKAGEKAEIKWNAQFEEFKSKEPELSVQFAACLEFTLNEGWDSNLPEYTTDDSPIATRAASGKALNAIAEKVFYLAGGSADLAPSNKTVVNSSTDFKPGRYEGRNMRFGVREHAMASIANGMVLHRGIRPYVATFLVFADYMRPAIRLASLMKLPMIYVFTHDSIAVGEDGPTHQPVETIASLRTIPGLTVLRPSDGAETSAAWKFALENMDGPTVLIMSRQKLPILDRSAADGAGLENGAYIIVDGGDAPDAVIIATGSEVHKAVEAAQSLLEKDLKVRVVDMPSWELFDKQSADYKEKVLPAGTKRIAVEAGISMGWEKYTAGGPVIAMTGFGASAPGGIMLEKFGFTADNIAAKTLELINA